MPADLNKALFVRLHEERCQGHSNCVRLAPAVFGCDAGGYVVLLQPGPVPADQVDAVRDAAACCPEGVIELGDSPG